MCKNLSGQKYRIGRWKAGMERQLYAMFGLHPHLSDKIYQLRKGYRKKRTIFFRQKRISKYTIIQYIVIKAIKYLFNIHLDHKYQFRYSLRINDHAKSQRRKLKLQLSDNQA